MPDAAFQTAFRKDEMEKLTVESLERRIAERRQDDDHLHKAKALVRSVERGLDNLSECIDRLPAELRLPVIEEIALRLLKILRGDPVDHSEAQMPEGLK